MTERIKCALLFLPALFATAAFLLSVLGNIYCSTIEFEPTSTKNDEGVLSLGVFYYQSISLAEGTSYGTAHSSCASYPSSTHFDAKWKTAKAFSIIAPVIGGICLFWTWMAPCYRPNKQQLTRGGYIYIFCAIFQSLTMIFLASNACRDNPGATLLGGTNIVINKYPNQCQLGPGSKMNIVSIIFWLGLGIALLVVPPPGPLPTPPVETQTVTYQRTTLPDGTVTVMETTVVKGTLPTTTNTSPDDKVLAEIEAPT